MILFGKKVFADLIKSIQHDLGPYKKGEVGCGDTHTYRGTCKGRHRGWGSGTTSQGTPKIACNHQKLGDAKKDLP